MPTIIGSISRPDSVGVRPDDLQVQRHEDDPEPNIAKPSTIVVTGGERERPSLNMRSGRIGSDGPGLDADEPPSSDGRGARTAR